MIGRRRSCFDRLQGRIHQQREVGDGDHSKRHLDGMLQAAAGPGNGQRRGPDGGLMAVAKYIKLDGSRAGHCG